MIAATRLAEGQLFQMPAVGLREQREERRRTLAERCEKVAVLVATKAPALVWCHMNAEGDLLEDLIKDGSQISGRDSDEAKEEKFLAFADGQLRVLITKAVIGAWGLNFQHCAHETFFPSHSFEQYYQGVRRCHRFGQTRSVHVDLVTTEGERGVMANLQRKAVAADKMFSRLVGYMNNAMHVKRSTADDVLMEVPAWL